MMEQKNGILLCFSEDDNRPIMSGGKGWVGNFHKFLTTLLLQISRNPVKIRMVSESSFDQVELKDFSVLIVVSTPALLSNKAFVHKLEGLAKEWNVSKEMSGEGTAGIFKIHLTPFDENNVLPSLRDTTSYDFYSIDPLTGRAREFQRFLDTEAEHPYWMKLIDLAYDINQVLSSSMPVMLDTRFNNSKPEALLSKKTVYLAATGIDLIFQRDVIKEELLQQGYQVLSHHSLSNNVQELEKIIEEDLAKCSFSIHLIGEDYGFKPKGSELSLPDIQIRLAAKHVCGRFNGGELSNCLVWLSSDLKNATERQNLLVKELMHRTNSFIDCFRFIQVPFHNLRSMIRGGYLFEQKRLTRNGFSSDEYSKVIYLIHDRSDEGESKPLYEYLEKSGYTVVEPAFEGDGMDVRYVHQENLRKCDGSIIYCNNAKEDWIKNKLQDFFIGSIGLGTAKKNQAKAIYMNGAKNLDLKSYVKGSAMILGNSGRFKPEDLGPFLSKLENNT